MGRQRLVVLAVVGLLASLVAAPVAAQQPPGLPLQISLGDSWAAGVGAPAGEGYVEQVHQQLRTRWDCLPPAAPRVPRGCRQLRLVDLSVGGATTTSLIATQLPAAVELLEQRNRDRNRHNDVQVVTLHIGGNDVVGPVLAACLGGLTPSCLDVVDQGFAAYRANLDLILSTLRTAAGPDTAIVIGTYDNPIATCELAPVPGAIQLGAMVLEGADAVPGGPIDEGLHDLIREVAAAHDVLVADAFGRLGPDDWVGGSDCLHPDASGYDVVTEVVLETLGVG
jgi:lysophospholipase L1-like esterase